MKSAQIKNAVCRGRPVKTFKLTADEMNNAVHASVWFNAATGRYNYTVGTKIAGSAKNHDYLRNRVMRRNLKDLADVSNNFARAFAIHTTYEDGSQAMMYVKATSK